MPATCPLVTKAIKEQTAMPCLPMRIRVDLHSAVWAVTSPAHATPKPPKHPVMGEHPVRYECGGFG
jgi:hypothetical protein